MVNTDTLADVASVVFYCNFYNSGFKMFNQDNVTDIVINIWRDTNFWNFADIIGHANFYGINRRTIGKERQEFIENANLKLEIFKYAYNNRNKDILKAILKDWKNLKYKELYEISKIFVFMSKKEKYRLHRIIDKNWEDIYNMVVKDFNFV